MALKQNYLVLAILAAVFSLYCVYAFSVYPEYSYADDFDFEGYKDDQGDLHAQIKFVSLPFFIATAVMYFLALKSEGPSKVRKTLTIVAMVVCAVMTLWSIVLSDKASFNEVFPAWLASGVFLLGLAAVRAIRSPKSGLA
jgi:hypothetical protein